MAGIAVYVLTVRGRRLEPLRLVLAGVALSYLFSAVTGWITVTADHGTLPGIVFFLLGSISSASWSLLAIPAAALALGVSYAVWRADHLDAAMTGEETAASLGICGRLVAEGDEVISQHLQDLRPAEVEQGDIDLRKRFAATVEGSASTIARSKSAAARTA